MRQHAVRAWDGMVTRLRHRLRDDPSTGKALAVPLAWHVQPMGAQVDLDDHQAVLAAFDDQGSEP